MGRRRCQWMLILVAACSLPRPGSAETVIFRGKVLLDDGSPPRRQVIVPGVSIGVPPDMHGGPASGKTGEYSVRLEVADLGGVFGGNEMGQASLPCILEASLGGFVSCRIDLSDPHVTMNPRLPDLVLTRRSAVTSVDLTRGASVPRAASRPWSQALKYLDAHDWQAAEGPLRAILKAAPAFAAGWMALGTACHNQHKSAEARPALERSIELDPKPLAPMYALAA